MALSIEGIREHVVTHLLERLELFSNADMCNNRIRFGYVAVDQRHHVQQLKTTGTAAVAGKLCFQGRASCNHVLA